ncbi:hypothetical protein NONO_c60310 [Nocardia nova SH22a]|uniref:Uncharacterized protein n=1 Tax=Nocardia nova SH22a TaxID=1415166 RepID=W5TNH7_9NOCA|nr:hypothetical protein [Nocardia nova]AHH20807.1 hypothetical protein NONO_c60310 [Nocardia nova SH22a]
MSDPSTRERCGAEFDFFERVVTICVRPSGHSGPHHPCQLAGDEETIDA